MRTVTEYPKLMSLDVASFSSVRKLMVDREYSAAEVSVVHGGVKVRCNATLKPDEVDELVNMLMQASTSFRERRSDAVGNVDGVFHEQAEQDSSVGSGKDGVVDDPPSIVEHSNEGGVR